MLKKYNSRLSRQMERQTKRNFLLAIGGIILVGLFLFKFGVPLLINLSLHAGNKGDNESQNNNSVAYIPPPQLDPLPTATNSASIAITGIADKGFTIKLYVNDEVMGTTIPNSDGTFTFTNVPLKDGSNTIKAKATNNLKDSNFTQPATIQVIKKGPDVSIDSPSDNDHFSGDKKQVTVSGKTTPGAKVTVNDFWAITDSDGKYSYNLPLKDGDNPVKVIATDDAGNKSEKDITLHYDH